MENRIKTINPLQKSYTFLDYEVLPELREIHRVKTPIKMSKKSFDILLVLIESQGRVVTKEQLIEKVWANQIVTDAALNKQIARLRNDLAGSETTQPIIETVRGVGIRLVPPVNQVETENLNTGNNQSKNWWWLALAVIIALFSYTQFNKVSTTKQIVSPALSLQDTMVEIRSAMSINKKAFISQIKRRNELGKMLNKRFDMKKDLSWERRFLKYHDKMNDSELFVFSQIRVYTEGPLLSSNQKTLDLINSKKEIIDEIPSADKLRNHLILWLNKYQKVFKNNPKMSLLYVGVEDGAPYPSEVDGQVVNWLEMHKGKNTPKQPKSINIAVVGSQNADDWLNVGGLEYLTTQLRAHQEIQTITPRAEWSQKGDSKYVSIALSQKQGIDYVLTIKSLSKKDDYQASLVLRNDTGIFSKEIISAPSLNLLFERIDSWVTRQLKISAKIIDGKVTGYKPTEFALESYLRGHEIAKNKNYSQAIQLMQTAVNDDPQFFYAWILLANLESLSGNSDKALALIKHLEKREDFDENILNALYQVKASVLIALHQAPEAKVALNKAIELSKKQNDMLTLIDTLQVQADIELDLGPMSEKTIIIFQEQLILINEYSPDPFKIAYAKLNLAQLYQHSNRQELAIKFSKEAYDLFNKDHNVLGLFQSAVITAAMYNGRGETKKALLILNKVKESYQQIESFDAKAVYLKTVVDSQMYLGLRKQALANIEKLKQLAFSHNDDENVVLALVKSVELHILFQEYQSAQADIKQLKAILTTPNHAVSPVYQMAISIYEVWVAAYTDPPKLSRSKFDQHLKQFPDTHIVFAKEMRYVNAIILSRTGFDNAQAIKDFRELIELFKNENEVYNALDVGFLLLDLQWKISKEDYVKTMNHLDELSTFKYPMDKYKAQYLAFNKDYINAYVTMADLKSKANEFWTTQDQMKLEEYQQLAQQK
jgi:DNA-binding winged helix-turn-helix (wHTH) protein/tetratricopeptide (TPR) repeat protein